MQQPDTGQVRIVIGGGGVWFCARLRAIAAEARIGAALAGAYETILEGPLPEPGSYLSPPARGADRSVFSAPRARKLARTPWRGPTATPAPVP